MTFARTTIALAAILAAYPVAPAPAHPHVFVEGSATLEFDPGYKVSRVTVRYALDEMTTAVLVEGLDSDGNGIFERDELKALAEENAEALAEFDYFLEVSAKGERIAATGAVDTDYAYEGDRLVLTLTLALERPIAPASEPVAIRLYDPTFYVLVELSQETPIYVSGVAEDFCTVTVKGPAQASDGVSLPDAMLGSLEPSANIGRDYADEILLSCGAGRS